MSDDLLDPSEIDALLGNAGAGAGAGAPTPAPPPAGDPPLAADVNKVPAKEILSQSDLDSLFQQATAGGAAAAPPAPKAPPPPQVAASRTPAATENLLNQMENDLASVLAGDSSRLKPPPASFGSPSPFELNSFDSRGPTADRGSLGVLEEVDLDLRVELGRTELLIEEVLKLREGAVVPLDKLAGDPVDVIVNGRLVARGEVLVLNDNFCVRIAEILAPTL